MNSQDENVNLLNSDNELHLEIPHSETELPNSSRLKSKKSASIQKNLTSNKKKNHQAENKNNLNKFVNKQEDHNKKKRKRKSPAGDFQSNTKVNTELILEYWNRLHHRVLSTYDLYLRENTIIEN